MSLRKSTLTQLFGLCFLLLAGEKTFAGYDCKTYLGDSVKVFTAFPRGTGVTIKSKGVTDFYKKELKVEISHLISKIDPETKKYTMESVDGGYLFGVGAEIRGVDNLWSLFFKVKPNSKAEAVLSDMMGSKFHFNLTCKRTPDLE